MAQSSNYPPYPQQTGLAPTGGGGTTQGAAYYPPTPGQGGSAGATTDANVSGGAPMIINRQSFIKSYADMVARTWTDPSYLDLLLSDPAGGLSKVGIATIPGAVIRVIEHKITGTGKIEDQVDAWLRGNTSGLYDLFLPIKPDEFDASPGGSPDACAGGGCCCCPCCCCT